MPSKIRIWPLLLIAVALFLPDVGGSRPDHPKLRDGKECYNWRAHQAVWGSAALPLNQKNIGSCVAVSGAGVCDGENAMAYLSGKFKSKPLRVAPEGLYGGRAEVPGREQRGGDGWYGSAFAQYVTDVGGMVFQKNYPEYGIDLSGGYTVARCREWGQYGTGGQKDGINGPFDAEARKHKFDKRARISTLDELIAALENYHFVETCSGIGYDSPRDKDGFCARRGSWSHAQFFAGRRTKEVSGRDGFLVVNSWNGYIPGDGPNSKNKYPFDQPDGTYWVTPADALAMLRAGDSWAVTYGEFKAARELPWMHVEHAQVPPELLQDDIGDAVEPIKPSETFKALLKPVSVEEYAKLDGIAKPVVNKSSTSVDAPSMAPKKSASACSNGSCSTFTRRRWFR